MANIGSEGINTKTQRVFRWMAVLVVLALVITAAWTQPAGAGNGTDFGDVPAPSVPTNPLRSFSPRSYNLPLSLQDNGLAQPPVPNQGGTCISGYLIDSYHQMLGAGWEITLSRVADGDETKTTTTNDQGQFIFSDLPAGNYMLELEMTDGWRPFTPTSFQVTLSGIGEECAQVRYKLEALPCIEVVKLDAGGEVDGENVGVPNWGFSATQGDTQLAALTDGKGSAFFYNLTPGKWVVTEEEKTGWRPAEGYGSSLELDLVSPVVPGTCQTALFVNEQVHDACVIVQKTDIAGNPVEGWNMAIARNDGTQAPAEGTTDEDGQILFDHLALGQWTVTEEVRDWWRPLGETSINLTLERPGFCQVVKFVNEPLSCVDGYKINHLEQPLQGWQINASNEDTGQQFSTVTDENGYFSFNTLSLGNWVISEELQPGWEPVTAPEFTVNLTEPFECTTVRFKNRTQFACVDVFKKDEFDGAGLPGWKITLQPAFGGEATPGITDGTGWVRFSELTPGTYTITEEVLPGWTPTSAEEVTVDLAASGSCSVINFYNIQTHMIPEDPPKKAKDKPEACNCPMYYTVRHGDTVWALSQRFGVPVSAIARVNHLKNASKIYTGQRLCIPLGDP